MWDWTEFGSLRPRAHPSGAFDWQWPIRRSRAPPRRPERPTPPDMTPGDSQGRPRAAGARGWVTWHRYVGMAGSLQPADLRPWRPNLDSCGRLGGRAGP